MSFPADPYESLWDYYFEQEDYENENYINDRWKERYYDNKYEQPEPE